MPRTHESAINDLRALGIDSAELRWAAVRDYMQELRDGAKRDFNRAALLAEFADRAENNARRRGIEDVPGWGVRYERIDVLTARAETVAKYNGKVRERALAILEAFMPI